MDALSLRGVSHRTKTSRRGVPFICVGSGLLSRPDSPATWCFFFHLLEERRQDLRTKSRLSPLPQIRFSFGMLCIWDTVRLQDALPPLQYGVAFKWLRKLLAGLVLGAKLSFFYTLRSTRATLWSWMNQLVPSSSLLTMQGHYGVDNVALYGRDDVLLPLSGQKALMRALLLGLRPTTPQYRGGQLPLREPQV